MPQPTPFTRSFSFTDFQAGNPTVPLPGQKVDSELDGAAQTFADILRNLALIQRDDGQLVNGVVGSDALNQAVILAIAAAVVAHTKGADGLNAPNPVFTFSITTRPPGAEPTIGVSGVYPNLQLAFGLPVAAPLGGAVLADADYGDVAVSAGGTVMTVQAVGGEDPFRPGNLPTTDDVTGLAAMFAAIGAPHWADILDIPATFPPDAHSHTIADVDGLTEALAAKADTGDFATTAQLDGKADAFTPINTINTNTTASDAAHNGEYNKLTGGTNRTITFNGVPQAGHASTWVNRGTANTTISCGGGYYKNGSSAKATANFTLAPGDKMIAFHEGAGVWTFEIVG